MARALIRWTATCPLCARTDLAPAPTPTGQPQTVQCRSCGGIFRLKPPKPGDLLRLRDHQVEAAACES